MIDISIDPASLEFSNGDWYSTERLTNALLAYCKQHHPHAEINIQVGYRQGHGWARIDGDDDLGEELLNEFWNTHAGDSDLFEENDG